MTIEFTVLRFSLTKNERNQGLSDENLKLQFLEPKIFDIDKKTHKIFRKLMYILKYTVYFNKNVITVRSTYLH